MKLHSIYVLFDNYTKEEIDNVISYLSEEEKDLITKRYGNDLSNPINNKEFTKEDRVEFYGTLKPKMINMLKNQKNGNLENYLNNNKKRKELLHDRKQNSSKITENKKEITKSKVKIKNEIVPTKPQKEEVIDKEDYTKILDFIKIIPYSELTKGVSSKDAILTGLWLGYVDDKKLSISTISKIFDISEEEVGESIKRGLELFKEKFISTFVSFINIASNNKKLILSNNK